MSSRSFCQGRAPASTAGSNAFPAADPKPLDQLLTLQLNLSTSASASSFSSYLLPLLLPILSMLCLLLVFLLLLTLRHNLTVRLLAPLELHGMDIMSR